MKSIEPLLFAILLCNLVGCATLNEGLKESVEVGAKAFQQPPAENTLNPASNTGVSTENQKVYSADECIGPIIMGECKGSIIEKEAYHPTCHGAWLNGQCTGPLF